MSSRPGAFTQPRNHRARSDPLAPQRSRGDHNSRKRTSLLGKLTRGGLGKPLRWREGFHIWLTRSHGLFLAPPPPQPSPHFVAEREPETSAGGSPTPVLPPLQGSAHRSQGNGSIPHPLLITPFRHAGRAIILTFRSRFFTSTGTGAVRPSRRL